MVTDKNVLQLHSLLKQFGISHIVTSPGCRQFSLITALEQDDYFSLYSVVDERSAAFFAIGLIQEKCEPVAIMCTSGTACANYTSAVVEAFYQRLPLLVISGDRLPELINQSEDQLYDQIQTFKGFTKKQVQLPKIETELDEWYTNRLINEAIIELTHHGNGPVHIDYPTVDIFEYRATPSDFIKARKIDLYTAESEDVKFKECADFLIGKKVCVVWGQSVWKSKDLEKAVNEFVKKNNAVILTDYMSNVRYNNTIVNTLRILGTLKSREQIENLMPDVLIYIGGNTIFNSEIKGFVKNHNVVFWQVGLEDNVIDGYRNLTRMFEMSEGFFFRKMCLNSSLNNNLGYYEYWNQIDEIVATPNIEGYKEQNILRLLLENLPSNFDLQLANSWSTRLSQQLDIRKDIRVFCNRGANGIDGSLSTAVGFATSNKNMPLPKFGVMA